MSGYNVEVPKTKFGLIEWRNYQNEKPSENDNCLVVVGSDVLAARYTRGAFFANSWSRVEKPYLWSPWPKAPVA